MGELVRPAKCGDCPQFQTIREPTRSQWGGRCACLGVGRDVFSDSCDQPRNWGKKGENNSTLKNVEASEAEQDRLRGEAEAQAEAEAHEQEERARDEDQEREDSRRGPEGEPE